MNGTVRSLLGDRTFRLLVASRAISVGGSVIAPVAQAFAVLEIGGGGYALGLVLACGFAPQLAFLLMGGVLGDRLPKAHVMLGSNILSCVSQAVAGVLLVMGMAEVWHLAATAAVTGAATALFGPASQGIVPEVVGDRDLRQANALMRTCLNGVKVAAPALGGVLVAAFGSGYGYLVDAATFACAAFLIAMLPRRTGLVSAESLVQQLGGGWHGFWSRDWLWSTTVAMALTNVAWAAAFQTLGPLRAERDLGGASAWGLITGSLAVGLIVGGPLMLRWHPARPLVAVCLGSLAKLLPLGALAWGLDVVWVAAATAVAGLGIEVVVVCSTTVIQERVPDELLSRVFSYDMLFSTALLPVGYLAAGPMVDLLGLGVTVMIAGALTLVASVAPLTLRSVRTMSGTPVDQVVAA